MITANFEQLDGEIGALVARFADLPRHIARKHLKAALRAAIKPAVPILRKNTPPLNARRGRKKAGAKRSSGALRRSVKTVAGGRGLSAWACLGYKAGDESRKAIWLEFGTSDGIAPRDMVKKTVDSYSGKAKQLLAGKLAESLEKAAKELASGRNPGRR